MFLVMVLGRPSTIMKRLLTALKCLGSYRSVATQDDILTADDAKQQTLMNQERAFDEWLRLFTVLMNKYLKTAVGSYVAWNEELRLDAQPLTPIDEIMTKKILCEPCGLALIERLAKLGYRGHFFFNESYQRVISYKLVWSGAYEKPTEKEIRRRYIAANKKSGEKCVCMRFIGDPDKPESETSSASETK